MKPDAERLELALRVAELCLDDEGVAHSLRVCRAVKELGGSVDAQVAALLHDVFEDALGPRVVRVVELLTRRTLEIYGNYIVRLRLGLLTVDAESGIVAEDAKLVKIADLGDNLIGRPTRKPELEERYRLALEILGADKK